MGEEVSVLSLGPSKGTLRSFTSLGVYFIKLYHEAIIYEAKFVILYAIL